MILTPLQKLPKMYEIWANLLLPNALNDCQKCNKSPNLVTLYAMHDIMRCMRYPPRRRWQKSLSLILWEESRDQRRPITARLSGTSAPTHLLPLLRFPARSPALCLSPLSCKHPTQKLERRRMIYGLTTVPTPNWFPPSSNLGYWNCILSHSRSGRLSLGAFARYSQFDVCALRKIEVGYIGRRHT